MKYFILSFMILFFSVNFASGQTDTIAINQKKTPPRLLIGIDIAKLGGTGFNSVPIALRYNIKSRFTNRFAAILYAGYDNYKKQLYNYPGNGNSVGLPNRGRSPYQSEGIYVNAGLDYAFNYTPNQKGAWIVGFSGIYTNFYDNTSFIFTGNFFDNYTKEVNRKFDYFGTETRLGHLYQITNHFYLYAGIRVTVLDVMGETPYVYAPYYVPGKGLSTLNIEFKAFYKLF